MKYVDLATNGDPQGGGSTDLTEVLSRISTLENKHVITTRFASISAGSGTVTPPAESTIRLDDFGGTTDAIVTTIVGGKPSNENAYTAGGEVISTTFDGSGSYVLSGIPSSYPVALVYRVVTNLVDFDGSDSDIVGELEYLVDPIPEEAHIEGLTNEGPIQSSVLSDVLQALGHTLWETGRSGLKEWFGSGNYWSFASGTFTLLRGGEGYIRHKEVIWAGGQTVAIGVNEAAYLYIDEDGVLQKSATNSKADKKSRINLFRVQNDINSAFFAMRNDHAFDTDVGAREWIDQGFGVVVSDLQGYAEIIRYGTGTGASANDRMVNISAGDITDADIVETWDAVTTGVTVNHTYRRSDGAFARDSFAQVFPMKYNLNGTPTALGNGDFGVFRLFLVKSSLNNTAPQFISEMHTAKFANLTAAQTAIAGGLISNYGGFDKDLAQAGFVIVVMNASGGYVAEARVAKTTLRQVTAGTGTGSTASNVLTDTSAFNGALGVTETTVQAALNKLDDIVGNTRFVNTSQTLLPTDSLILVDTLTGNRELTLPLSNVTPPGKMIRILNYVQTAGSNCYVFPQSGYTIDGFGTTTSNGIRLPYKASVTLIHIGDGIWRIMLTENWPMRVVTANTSSMTTGDELVRLLPMANQIFYLYSTVSAGKRITVYRDKFNGTSFTCTVQDGGGAYINNLASIKLAPGECVTLISGNGEWFVESTTTTLMMQTAPAKATPIDADKFFLQDTVANNAGSVVTLAQLKAVLKTYFDTLYTPL
jgi:hypothetical protein